MVHCALTYDALLAYTDGETARWREWFRQHPDALAVPFGEGMLATVGDVVAHTFSAELRYTQRLLGVAVTPPEQLQHKTFDTTFALGDQARALLKQFFASATPEVMQEVISFPTMTAGVVTASKHKIASNLFLHANRHWAQVASMLRQAGFKDQWPHDFLLSDVEL